MAQQRWYADGRVLRTRSELTRGTRNPFLNNADLVDINDLIYQIVYGIIPGTPTGAINASNGLTGIVNPTSYDLTLGGSLVTNTTLDGASTYSFNLDALTEFSVDSNNISLNPTGGLFINSPSLGTASNGYVWTLIDSNTGEGEWTAVNITDANNGLNLDTGIVQLGGNLIENTIVDGDSFAYSLQFTNLSNLVETANQMDLKAFNLFTLQVPNTSGVGLDDFTSVLTLLDNSTGESEFRPNNRRHSTTVTSTPVTLTAENYYVFLDPTTAGGSINVELPDPVNVTGMKLVLKQITAGTTTSSSITFPGAGPIYTDSVQPNIGTTTAGEVVKLVSDGTYWQVI